MKNPETYELILNHITAMESMHYSETYDDYKQMAYLFLNHKGKWLFKEDILLEFREGRNFDEILAENPDRFVRGANHKKDGKMEATWYDIWSTEEIERDDSFFDFFFACKLRHLDLIEVDDFLDHHLVNSFEGNNIDYNRFLNIALRKHRERLTPEIITTVQEWINSQIANLEKDGGSIDGIKGRIKREQGDNKTCLTVVQTALLIEYLQKAKIILPTGALNYKQAGEAFYLLTGYSPDSLRQQMGTKGQQSLRHEDYQELRKVISDLVKIIDSDIKGNKQN